MEVHKTTAIGTHKKNMFGSEKNMALASLSTFGMRPTVPTLVIGAMNHILDFRLPFLIEQKRGRVGD